MKTRLWPLLFLFAMASCVHRPPGPEGETAPPTHASENRRAALYEHVLSADYQKYANDIIGAIETFEKSLKEYPDAADLRYHYINFLLESAFNINDQNASQALFFKALKEAETAAARFPENVDIVEIYIDILIEIEKFPEALKFMEQLTRRFPEDIDMKIRCARLYIENDEFRKAIDLLTPYIAKASDEQRADIYKISALAYDGLGDYSSAIDVLKKSLEIIPDDFESMYNLSRLYIVTGDDESAQKILLKSLEIYPDSVDMRRALSELYQKEEDYKKAIDVLYPLIFNDNAALHARLDIAKIYILWGKSTDAVKWLEEILEEDSDNPVAVFYLALAYSDLKKWDDAYREISKLYKGENTSIPVIDLMSQIEAERGHLVDALRLLEASIRHHPKEQRLYLKLGLLYLLNDMPEKSVEVFRRGLENLPGDRELILHLGMALDKVGKWKKAIDLVNELLKSNPDDPELCNFVGYTLADHDQNLEEAERLLIKALEKEPDTPAFLDSMGWIYFKQGKYEKAADLLKRALTGLRTDEEVLKHLYHTYIHLGELDEAEGILHQLEALSPDNEEYKRFESELEKLKHQ